MNIRPQFVKNLSQLPFNGLSSDERALQATRADLIQAESDQTLLNASGYFCDGATAGATARALKQRLERLQEG